MERAESLIVEQSSASLRARLAATLGTTDSITPTVLRVALGLVMLPHGAQKALGWFGGGGIRGTLAYFESIAIPTVTGVLVIAAEFLGALALLAGLGTRVAAAGIGAVMLGAALIVHVPHGFFMNWFGNQAGEGFEFHVLAIAMAIALVVQGGGRYSLDRALSRDR